mgnify:CR=1 FL=1
MAKKRGTPESLFEDAAISEAPTTPRVLPLTNGMLERHLRLAPGVPGVPLSTEATFRTDLGALVVGDCLTTLRQVPDSTFDLVVTSPPYDGQPKYGNGERYDREWYRDFFMSVTQEILRTLKPRGSFVLNYRSKRHGDERGTLQYELVFWLRAQGFLFCDDFVWGKPSPPPGRFNRFLKDAVEYCFHFAKTPDWQFFPEHCLAPARWDAKDRERRKRLAHNFVRVNSPSGQGRSRVQAGPDMVRPSTLLSFEAEFGPNAVRQRLRDFYRGLVNS